MLHREGHECLKSRGHARPCTWAGWWGSCTQSPPSPSRCSCTVATVSPSLQLHSRHCVPLVAVAQSPLCPPRCSCTVATVSLSLQLHSRHCVPLVAVAQSPPCPPRCSCSVAARGHNAICGKCLVWITLLTLLSRWKVQGQRGSSFSGQT